jgi:hypothetical protein
MIDMVLQKQISNKISTGGGETSSHTSSPQRTFQSAKDEGEDEFARKKSDSPSDFENNNAAQQEENSEEEKDEVDEFYDCVDNYKGIEILKMHEISELNDE